MPYKHVYHLPSHALLANQDTFIPLNYLPQDVTGKRKRLDDEIEGQIDDNNTKSESIAQDTASDTDFSSSPSSAEDNESVSNADSDDVKIKSSSSQHERKAANKRGLMPRSSSKYLRPDVIRQYQTAGLSLLDETPPKPFPHAPAEYQHVAAYETFKNAKAHLDESKPLLQEYPVWLTFIKPSAQKDKHLGIMNALVHRFLAQGDYARASQAWGLLIRAMPRGTDVRTFGWWGIGAEILLRRPENFGNESLNNEFEAGRASTSLRSQSRSSSADSSVVLSSDTEDEIDLHEAQTRVVAADSDSDTDQVVTIRQRVDSDDESTTSEIRITRASTTASSSSQQSMPRRSSDRNRTSSDILAPNSRTSNVGDATLQEPIWLADSNLESAKSYYETMIMRYESRERNVTKEQQAKMANFFPAFMSVWIYQIVQRTRKAIWQFDHDNLVGNTPTHRITNTARATSNDNYDNDHIPVSTQSDTRKDMLERLRTRELVGAKEIAQRLDEVLDRPLYNRNIQLLNLRGMVGQWIMDLVRPDTTLNAEIAAGAGDDVSYEDDEEDDGYFEAMRRSITAFQRARACEMEAGGVMDDE